MTSLHVNLHTHLKNSPKMQNHFTLLTIKLVYKPCKYEESHTAINLNCPEIITMLPSWVCYSSQVSMHSFVCCATKFGLRYGFCSCAFLLVVGLYYSLYASPPDYMQGDLVRIMYLHVPAAWISLGTYFLIAVSGFVSLVKRNLVGATFSRAIAPIGACFTLVCLVAGIIWGKHTWGTWWVWDARLTSMLLLLFLYLGYILLWNVFEDQRRAAKTTALFAVFSAVNVPIVKFSVNIWATLHQPSSIIRKGGIAVDSEMLFPLIFMFVVFTMLCIVLTTTRMSTLIAKREVHARTSSLYGEAL